jgi:hypothetical protein
VASEDGAHLPRLRTFFPNSRPYSTSSGPSHAPQEKLTLRSLNTSPVLV